MAEAQGTLRAGWGRGRAKIGPWCAVSSTLSVEALARSGFDWLIFDLQHGLISLGDLSVLMPAAASGGIPVIIRVPWNEPAAIMKALDAGAEGVIIPMVNSAADAERAVSACRFPPRGTRSWGPVRHVLHSADYTPARADHDTVCIVMVETVEAVERIDEITNVKGIDGVLVGPSDLAISAGLAPTGRPTEPEHLRLINTVLDACRAKGIVAGIACGDAAWTRRWREAGFDMLAVPSDLDLLRAGAIRFMSDALDGSA